MAVGIPLRQASYALLLALSVIALPIAQPVAGACSDTASNDFFVLIIGVGLKVLLHSSNNNPALFQLLGTETFSRGRSLLAGASDHHEHDSTSQLEHQNTADSSTEASKDKELVLITAHESRLESPRPSSVEFSHKDDGEETEVATEEHLAPPRAVVLITGVNQSEIKYAAPITEEQVSDSPTEEEPVSEHRHGVEHGHELEHGSEQDPEQDPESSISVTEEVNEEEVSPEAENPGEGKDVVLIFSADETVQIGPTISNITSSQITAEVPQPEAEIQKEPKSLQKPSGSITIKLRFPGIEYSDILNDISKVNDLTGTVKASIAHLVGINESDVKIIDLLPGSVIVDVQVDLYDEDDVQKIEETLISQPETVFEEEPYGIPEVQITGGSFISETPGGHKNETAAIPAAGLEDLQNHEGAEANPNSRPPPSKEASQKSSSDGDEDVAELEDTQGTAVFDSSKHVFGSLRFAWLNLREAFLQQEKLKRTVMFAMANVNGSHVGSVEVLELQTYEKYTKVEVKVEMIGSLDVMEYVNLFQPLKMETPQPTWVFGNIFVDGEFLYPTVEFREVADENHADETSSGEITSMAFASSVLMLLVQLLY